jgi:uncharacterized sulfatase
VKTVAEALKPAGYVSGHFGKWHLGENGHLPSDQGFEDALVSHGGGHFLPRVKTTPPLEVAEGAYLAEILTDRAIAFIEENRDRAFFLHLSHYAVHIPLEARQELIAKYQSREKTPGRINNPIYAAMLEHVDQSLGRVLHKLDELNLSQDTILVFFSDNGGLTRKFDGKGVDVTTNDPLRDEKGTLYEGGIRVPMIVRWTGSIQTGTLCEIPVSSVDFYPTFLDLADQPIPHQQLDGESLVSLLRQSGGLSRDALYWHYPHYHHSTPASAIRVADWKLIEFFEDGRVELYDLSNDIGESKNLAQEKPDKVKELSTRLDQWRRSVEAALPVPNPDFDPARRDSFGRVPRN